MTAPEARWEIERFLYREAVFLDEQRWDDWLGLFTEDAEFWVPAWKSEHAPTTDWRSEISLIYLNSRSHLEERISRIRSGRSAASLVLPRTAHTVSNVLVEDGASDDALDVRCLCVTHLYDPTRQLEFQTTARYELRLVRDQGDWRIARKKAIILNDNLPAKLDFYMI